MGSQRVRHDWATKLWSGSEADLETRQSYIPGPQPQDASKSFPNKCYLLVLVLAALFYSYIWRLLYSLVHACMLSHFSHVQIFVMLWTARLLCPWDSPGKNTAVGCHVLLGLFLTQGSNPCLLCLLHWQVGFLPLAPPWKPQEKWITTYKANFFGFGGRSTAGGCNRSWTDRGIFLEQACLVQAVLSRGMCWAPSRWWWILQRNIKGITYSTARSQCQSTWCGRFKPKSSIA